MCVLLSQPFLGGFHLFGGWSDWTSPTMVPFQKSLPSVIEQTETLFFSHGFPGKLRLIEFPLCQFKFPETVDEQKSIRGRFDLKPACRRGSRSSKKSRKSCEASEGMFFCWEAWYHRPDPPKKSPPKSNASTRRCKTIINLDFKGPQHRHEGFFHTSFV